ncbi:hypothetical protein M407DRAFT_17344 [Tulasnella calospora MUT 4182]|uniref:F-box domain-containing protein n=1 Tax=Tulasnella calospora MUT 4182 TaxID=1051891 RepID=A0A0C3QXE8_9AGAM|nr:hypothetical protein M407DRAFT_17344 [Tulasnella calospora MUT 4182]
MTKFNRTLEVDATPLRSWWPSTGRLLCTILPKLINLKSLHLQTSHCISNQLSSSLSRLRDLHTLHIKLIDTHLGPHAHTIANLRHLTLDLPYSPIAELYNQESFPFGDTIALLSNSCHTLETLTLRSASPGSTTSFASHLVLSPTRPLQNLLSSASSLKSISLQLEVNTSTPLTVAAIDAISTLGPKLTSLNLKCKPSMYPEHQPNTGYGIGLEVVQRICDKLPQLEELVIEDGEVGRSNIHRGGAGVAEEHLKSLLQLRNLRKIKFALLFDDLLFSLEPLNPPETPDIIFHSVFYASAVAKQSFNLYVDKNFTQLLHSILLTPSTSEGGLRTFPLPHLQSITVNTLPSPKLAAILRGFKVPPVGPWIRKVAWRTGDDDHSTAEFAP